MRTVTYLGLLAIAFAIKGGSIEDINSVFTGIYVVIAFMAMACDTFEFLKNMDE